MKLINQQLSAKFVNQARLLSKYSDFLRKVLPPECLKHVQVANIRNQSLMLITDSPVWTTRLRQLSPQILQALHKNPVKTESDTSATAGDNAQKIHHVQISTRYQHSVHSNDNNANTPAKHRLEISSKTADLLSQSAECISYQPLKSALLKMASHVSSHEPSNENGADSSSNSAVPKPIKHNK